MGEIKSFVFFDIETSGLPSNGLQVKMTELSFVACSKEHILNTQLNALPRVLYKLSFCVNPCKRIQCEASIISGLDNYILEHEEKFTDNSVNLILLFFKQLQKPICLVAHNGNNFDYPILQHELMKIKMELPNDILCVDSLPIFREIDKINDENEELCKPLNEAIIINLNEASTSSLRYTNETKDSKLNNEIRCNSIENNDKFYEDDNDITSAELIAVLDNAVEDDLNHMLGNTIEYNKHNKHTETYVANNISENQTILNDAQINEFVIKQNENINWREINETTPRKPNKHTNNTDDKKQNILSTSNNLEVTNQRKTNAQRSLFDLPPKKSYKLIDIYERFHGVKPEISHYAECDTITLLKCVIASKQKFIKCAVENCKLFSSIKPKGT